MQTERTDWFIVRVEHYGNENDREKMRLELEKNLRLKVLEDIQVFDISHLKLKFSNLGNKLRYRRVK